MSDHHAEVSAPRPGRDALLAQRFVSLADSLVDDFDLADLLDNLVRTCVDLLDVTAAGLLLIDAKGDLQPVAASTEATHVLELFQLQSDEGPCLDCVRDGGAVSVPDITAAQDRWPRFAPAVVANGFMSVHALPMRLRRETIGSLNLFHARPPTLSGDGHSIAQALADVATIAILQQRSTEQASQLAEQLQRALNTRIVIEQAKGVLAEYGGVPVEVAFGALRRHARDTSQKLGEVAEALVRGGTEPSSVLDRRRP